MWKLYFSLQKISGIEKICKRLELPLSAIKAARIIAAFQGTQPTWDSLHASLKELGERIDDEMNDRMFAFIPSERAKYFPGGEPLFGNAVEAAFPEMTADIEDAGLCLAVGSGTATVYHLMRVMEHALLKLTAKLKIDLENIDRMTWGQILGPIDAKIALTPKKTKEHDDCSEAALHLRHVKNAWRDPTMHNRRRYDQSEAEAIFQSVKTFINHLTTI